MVTHGTGLWQRVVIRRQTSRVTTRFLHSTPPAYCSAPAQAGRTSWISRWRLPAGVEPIDWRNEPGSEYHGEIDNSGTIWFHLDVGAAEYFDNASHAGSVTEPHEDAIVGRAAERDVCLARLHDIKSGVLKRQAADSGRASHVARIQYFDSHAAGQRRPPGLWIDRCGLGNELKHNSEGGSDDNNTATNNERPLSGQPQMALRNAMLSGGNVQPCSTA